MYVWVFLLKFLASGVGCVFFKKFLGGGGGGFGRLDACLTDCDTGTAWSLERNTKCTEVFIFSSIQFTSISTHSFRLYFCESNQHGCV